MNPINVFKPKFRTAEILSEIKECLDNGWTGLGFKTIQFEKDWKKYTGFNYAHFLNSNTAGLHLAVKILKDVNKWQDDDEIITTPLTFISTNHAIIYENLTPIFADVDDQLCLDPDSIVANITRKTRAIMFVGIGGNIGQYKKIVKICKKYKLKLILDAAHMSGTMVNDIQVGHDADVSIFSFQAVKNLATADSGMICFKNGDYDELARKMSWLGIDKDTYSRTHSPGNYKWDYDVPTVGYKYHGNSIMAAMGIVQLKYLNEDNDHRRMIAQEYEKLLVDIPGIQIIKHNTECKSSRHLFQISVNGRDELLNYLNINGINPGVHYKDNTTYSVYKTSFGKCPTAHKISNKLLTLPIHCYMTKKDVKYIVGIIKKWTDI